MADSLDLIRAKLGRAQDLITYLHGLPDRLPGNPFYGMRVELDRKRRFVFRTWNVKDFPPLYPLVVGEIAHQLRSSLDHIAFALANPPPTQESKVKFPLCSSRKEFKRGKSALIKVPRGVLTRVDSVQPYHHRKWPDTKLLSYLQAISNWDKHRTLTVAVVSLEGIEVGFKRPQTLKIVSKEQFRGPIKENKIIARFEVEADGDFDDDLQPYAQFALVPVFDERGPKEVVGKNVLWTLEQTRAFILEQVLPLFEPFFE